MTQEPSVSVVIPAYKAQAFVGRAARSALSQTGVQVEVIAVDDASPDGTLAALQALADADPRVRVISNPRNAGPSVSRNRGIDAARGDWIAILDADDAYAPGRLARLTALAETGGFDIVADIPLFYDLAAGQAADAQLAADGGVETLTLERLLEATVSLNAPLDYGLLKPMFRAELARDGVWRYPEGVRHGEDFLVYFDVLLAERRFGVLHEPLYVFSTRIGGASGAFSPGSVTKVDYRGIAADTVALMARVEALPIHPARRSAINGYLNRRIERLDVLNAAYGWTTLRKGAFRRHFDWLTQDWRNGMVLAKIVLAKILSGRWLARLARRSPVE